MGAFKNEVTGYEHPDGYYRVLVSEDLPVLQLWTCGDGCCSEMERTHEYFHKGDIIYIEMLRMGEETYEVGSDYEGFHTEYYRPNPYYDYVAEGKLEWVGEFISED